MLRSFVVLAVSLAAVLGCASGPAKTTPPRTEVTEGWQYRWGDSPRGEEGRLVWLDDPLESSDWKPMPFPAKPPGSGERVWMRVRLPEASGTRPTLLLDPVLSEFDAYLDGVLVHSHGNVSSEKASWYGVPWTLLELEPGRAQVLTLRIRSAFWMIGVHGRAFVGSRSSHLEAIVKTDTPRFIAGVLGILIGIVAFGFAAVGTERRLTAPLRLYACGSGVYALFYTKLKDLLVDDPMLWADAHRWASSLSMVGLVVFVQQLFGPGPKKLVLRAWQGHLAVFLATQACIYTIGYRGLDLGIGWPLLLGEALIRVFIALEVVVILWVVIVEARRRDTNALIFLAGMAPSAAYTGRDLLAIAGLVHFDWDSQTYVGLIGIVLALSVIVARVAIARIRDYAVQLDRNAREKALLLKDLHDGIGGITTNISLLADVASRAKSEAHAQQAIADISELSREGIAEIRSFLDSLDQNELGWPQLVNQMRHVGRVTLEPHGVAFHLTSAVDRDAPKPTSALYLNVARVFREMLTNTLKHAGASNVRVEITVIPEELRMSAMDDGAGFEPSKATDGRGLANMRARAADLGGSVDVDSAEGTRIVLSIPLPPAHPAMGVSASPITA